jgi:hypothetical protein
VSRAAERFNCSWPTAKWWASRYAAIRCYVHEAPGAMIHIEVKMLGNIPDDGGGWLYGGRQQGDRNRAGTPDKARNQTP